MDNFKCLTTFGYDNLNKKDTNAYVDFIDICENLHKELSKFLKIAKKFQKQLKLANLEKEELILRLDKSNKKNEFLRNQFSSQDEKMKSLEQELAYSKAKLENLTSTKHVVDDRSVFVSIKPKDDKVYIPPCKRNHKDKTYFTRLDKDNKIFDVNAEVSKPMLKPTTRVQKKSFFVHTCHLCGVVGHIRPNYSLLRKKPKLIFFQEY